MATVGPAHIDIVGWGNVKAASTSLNRVQSASFLTGGSGQVTGSALNNYYTWDVPLIAGTWTITVIYDKDTNGPITTASLDGVDLSPTVDAYAASSSYNNVVQWTGISVATGGIKEFKLRADSKNASSSGYVQRHHLITFTNTDNQF